MPETACYLWSVLGDDACYDALLTRDRRFDGVFFVGVSTTGIYCRPICPARTPGRTRCTFYASSALAERAGFRACFRCRPELAPGNASTDAIDALVAAAAARIAEGALNDASVDALADELGVSARHLRRAMEDRLGVSPVDLAQTRRLALAKQLLQDTRLPLTEIAFAAGFGSVRRFNAVFGERMGSAPSRFRHQRPAATGDVVLRLDYREPFDWPRLLGFLRARAIPGVETVGDDGYARIVHLHGATGRIAVHQAHGRLALALAPALVPVVMPLVARVRRLFDLDARPDAIAAVLGRDPRLATLLAARPGLRVPGAIDPFEAAVRAMLGQQVSVAAATTLAGRVAARFGTPVDDGVRFPTAAEVARQPVAAVAAIGLPAARAAALHGVAVAIATGTLRLDGHDVDAFVTAATVLPGIGPWTAHYLAMRALHLPDAFPAADLGILKALGGTARDAEARSQAWRPFRSYAVMHLWHALGEDHVDHDDDDARLPARRAAPARPRRRADRPVPSRAAGARGAARHAARARARRAPARGILRR